MLTDRACHSPERRKSEIKKQSGRMASCISMPCSRPRVTSKLEVARWTAVSPGSGKHVFFADVFQAQGGRGGTNWTREVSTGGQSLLLLLCLYIESTRQTFDPVAG